MKRITILATTLFLAACGGSQSADKGATPAADKPADKPAAAPADPAAVYAALEVGADYKSYNKVSTGPFLSPTHGKRFVEIYVNDIGLEAYKTGEDSPVGTVIVKSSWEAEGKGDARKATDVPGPLFVMKKMEAGFDDDHNNWWYGLHWEQVPAKWQKAMGGAQAYWRWPSKKVNYCSDCHDNYPGEVGLPAKGFRAWEAK